MVVNSACRFESYTLRFAVCPGGEVAVLKIVGLKGLARSNRVHGIEERVTSFRASRTFIDLHLLSPLG